MGWCPRMFFDHHSSILKRTNPELVQRVLNAFVRGAIFVEECPDESANIASRYIGINARFIRSKANLPLD